MISIKRNIITTSEWTIKFFGKTKNVTKRKRNEAKYKIAFFAGILSASFVYSRKGRTVNIKT